MSSTQGQESDLSGEVYSRETVGEWVEEISLSVKSPASGQ